MGELIDKMKGKLKQAEGDLTGDRARKAEGLVDEVKGSIKGAFEELKHGVKKAMREDEEHEAAERRAQEEGEVQR